MPNFLPVAWLAAPSERVGTNPGMENMVSQCRSRSSLASAIPAIPEIGVIEYDPRPAESGQDRITLLSVSSVQEDHDALEELLSGEVWSVARAPDLESGIALLRDGRIPVVLCARDLLAEAWKHLLSAVAPLQRPPVLILTSRLSDGRLWAEALNLGAYDVLKKPFEVTELTRSLSLAWLHWKNGVTGSTAFLRGGCSGRGVLGPNLTS